MFEEVEARLARLRAFLPLDAKMRDRVARVLDPLFIYHSNALEGNTLSLAETIYFIQSSTLPAGKREEEILEVRGQQAAIGYLERAIEDRVPISEKLVRELHELLTRGLTEREYAPGQYKPRDNMVRLADDTLFPYVSFIETPAAMEALVAWHRVEASKLHPIEHAAIFHYRFILIHPFLDGNGRTARLLTRLIMAERGYPAVPILRGAEHRDRYVQALRAVDTSVPATELHPENSGLRYFPLVSYFETEVLFSLDEILAIVEGRKIVTPEDLLDRFSSFEQKALERAGLPLDEAQRQLHFVKSVERLTEMVRGELEQLLLQANDRLREFEVRWQFQSGRAADLAKWGEPYARVFDRAPTWGTFGIVRLELHGRDGGLMEAQVPKNQFELIITAEPHRLCVFAIRGVVRSGTWSWGPDPSEWRSLLSLPTNPETIRASDLLEFLMNEIGKFLDLVAPELATGAR